MIITYGWPFFLLLCLACVVASYIKGWRRLQIVYPSFATPFRLYAFLLSIGLLVLALIWPLPGLSNYFLLARTTQKAFLIFLAAPLSWLACCFHIIGWGLPTRLRRGLTRYFVRSSSASALIGTLTAPGIVWFFFLASFLCWHDSTMADFILAHAWLRRLAPLWLLATAWLFWHQIIDVGPRHFRMKSDFARLACLVSVEVPNIASGIFIAFQTTPLYFHYAALRAAQPAYYNGTISLINDQVFSGAINWILGTTVYFGSIILLINAIWQRSGGSERPQPPLNWDADEKFIMPGLEARLRENQRKR